jgi:signal peptidase II
LKRVFRGWGLVALVAAVVVLADQLSKNWIRNNIPLNSALAPFAGFESWFRLVHWNNTGAAFGIMQGQGGIFVVIAVVVIVAVLIYLRQLPADEWAVKFCLGLMLGGAIGNLIDRLRFGQVTDFLLFMLPMRGRVLEWPAFNVADSCIVVGVILLAFLLLREDKSSPASPEPVEKPATPGEEQQDGYEPQV